MLFTNRVLRVGLLSGGIAVATAAQAGNQLFTGSWTVKAMGNERAGGTGASAVYSAFGIPQGIQCNPGWPRCPFKSTPTDGAGGFNPVGGYPSYGSFCAKLSTYGGGTTVRPAKGATPTTGGVFKRPIPPLYRNPFFFTSLGQPKTTTCTATSTGAFPGDLTRHGRPKGLVQVGKPVTGSWGAHTTGVPGKGGFNFAAAPANPGRGIRTTAQVGEFRALYPYLYSYTYATLRNDVGVFGPGSGPGSFNIKYYAGGNPVAMINVKQGAAKFGGTMRMLGALTSKVCYYRAGGCSLDEPNWRYEAIGASAQTYNGVVTKGYVATSWVGGNYFECFFYGLRCWLVSGPRFPWTTGSVTVTATGRGHHKTVHYAQGYDNRITTMTGGVTNVNGTIQLVTPVLTRWLRPSHQFETGGVGILRIKFVPEPQMWATLVAGVLLLGVATRMRAH